ncbi:spindle assembly abnormal protein [Perilla frutescens var. frutescens]|nr:spindle assembly abnormal protein [Perilla frutescens var. frutescens]
MSSKNKQKFVMRKMCPNYEWEDTLETVLEVPIPEEMFVGLDSNAAQRWQAMAAWMKAQTADKWSSPLVVGRYNEMIFIFSIVGCPILPCQILKESCYSAKNRRS